MKRPLIYNLSLCVTLVLFPFYQALALEGRNDNIRIDALKSLTINHSMTARFESEASALAHSSSLISSEKTKRDLLNIQYKIKALNEDKQKLTRALPERVKANEFLKEVVEKSKMRTTQESGPLIESSKFKQTATHPAAEQNLKLHERALEYISKKELAKAIKLYEEIILNDPNDDEAYMIMGHCQVLSSDFEKGEQSFQSAAHINPQDLNSIIPFYENLIRRNPTDANAFANFGFVCLMFAETRRAEDLFQQSLSLDPMNPASQRGLEIIESQTQE